MFHLPREIIQLIFEFDPTYRQEYNKVLRSLRNLPAYYNDEPALVDHTYLYILHFPLYPIPHYYPPSKYYFYLLTR